MKYRTSWITVQLTISIMISLLCAGCGIAGSGTSDSPKEIQVTNTIQTDIEGLKAWIRLPLAPQKATWQMKEKGVRTGGIGPTDMELTAVLEYEPSVLTQLINQMVIQTSPAELYVAPDFLQTWMPAEFGAVFDRDPLFPDLLRLTVDRYNPNLFVSGSFQNGYVIVVGNTVLVHLNSV